MTFHARRSRHPSLTLALGLWSLAACTSAIERPDQPPVEDAAPPDAGENDGDPGLSDAGQLPIEESRRPCGEYTIEARNVLQAHCATCHGPGSPGEGELASVLDAWALVDDGWVIPDDPDNSPLYQQMVSKAMPPADASTRPSQAELESVRIWITCGAEDWPGGGGCSLRTSCPDPTLDPNERLALMRDDLQQHFAPNERLDVRYLDLAHLYNLGFSESQLTEIRQALHHLLNSLSRGPAIVIPQAIDDHGLILRIRLSDYGWSAATWERIIAGYPYAVSYDEDSNLWPFDEHLAEELREDTGTPIPHVQADWFFAHAARAPLYHDILALPTSLAELESQLVVDLAADVANHTVARAGFRDSGASLHNRVIERHALDDRGRGLWLTHDFADSTGSSDVLLHPLDFVAQGREILFELPNGLPAFMMVDGNGNRLDRAPSESVQDALASDRVMEAGLSCLNCHADAGIMRVTDEVREGATSVTDPVQRSELEALYPAQSVLDALFAADGARYLAARQALAADGYGVGTARALVDLFERPLNLSKVAAVLGLARYELEDAAKTFRDDLPESFVPFASVLNATIERATFDAIFPELVRALRLGEPLQSTPPAGSGGSASTTSDAP